MVFGLNGPKTENLPHTASGANDPMLCCDLASQKRVNTDVLASDAIRAP